MSTRNAVDIVFCRRLVSAVVHNAVERLYVMTDSPFFVHIFKNPFLKHTANGIVRNLTLLIILIKRPAVVNKLLIINALF